nr:hypothetical protein [uncultured Blautia sp.]
MKLSTLFPWSARKKKKALAQPKPYNIYSNYSCPSPELTRIITAYLNQSADATRSLQRIIETMAYNDPYRIPENSEIFPILEDLLQTAVWKSEWTADCGDYNPQRPDTWISCIYRVYDNKLRSIQCAEDVLRMEHNNLTPEAISDATYERDITPEMVAKKEDLQEKRDTIKATIDSGIYTPLDVLHLIEDSWYLLYPYQTSYEAIEYCIAASTQHTTLPYYSASLRDIGNHLGARYDERKKK